jgi:UDP-2-acetamido-3-amino-2,3-dideoxy-glucuronate N-acetyltransferase
MPRTHGENGTQVLEVLEAGERSLLEQGRPVQLARAAAAFYAHSTAVIDEGSEIGEGTKIWHFSHVMPGSRLGKNCNLGQNVVVSPGVIIGNNVKIQNNVSVYTGVELEDDVFCGPSMVFTNVVNPRSHIVRKNEYRRTLVKRGASIGANATVVCGSTLGKYSFVAAGAVVTRDVPDYALVMGVPAERVGWMCYCGIRLSRDEGEVQCPSCRRSYFIQGNSCTDLSASEPALPSEVAA